MVSYTEKKIVKRKRLILAHSFRGLVDYVLGLITLGLRQIQASGCRRLEAAELLTTSHLGSKEARGVGQSVSVGCAH